MLHHSVGNVAYIKKKYWKNDAIGGETGKEAIDHVFGIFNVECFTVRDKKDGYRQMNVCQFLQSA